MISMAGRSIDRSSMIGFFKGQRGSCASSVEFSMRSWRGGGRDISPTHADWRDEARRICTNSGFLYSEIRDKFCGPVHLTDNH